jgi:hypothetical protein
MAKPKATHYEEVPLEIVKKIVTEQSKQEKRIGQAGMTKRELEENPPGSKHGPWLRRRS